MQQIIEMLTKAEADRDELKEKLDSNQDRMMKFEEKNGLDDSNVEYPYRSEED
jgi:hypothetical protein